MNTSLEAMALAGRIIMENGGETYRVEETVTHLGHAFGVQEVQAFAIPSGIFISCRGTDGETVTQILRIHPGNTDLSRVDAVNQVSRQAEAGALGPREALAALRRIAETPSPYSQRFRVLAAGFCALGFTLMFAGGPLEALTSFVTAALVQLLAWLLDKAEVKSAVTCLFRGYVTTLLPMAFFALLGRGSLDPTVGGALMPLLPGLTMTIAVQDLLRGDTVSGSSHLLQATIVAAMVAAGALFAAMTMRMLGGLGA